MSDTGSIYVLLEPNENVIRYVGQTVQTLSTRLSRHLIDARRSENRQYHNGVWIRSVLASGFRPRIQLLAVVELPYLDPAEIEWISYMREIGCDLTNTTPGGLGGPTRTGMKTSEEVKAKQNRTKIGRKHTHETRQRLSVLATARNAQACMMTPEANAKRAQTRAAERAMGISRYRPSPMSCIKCRKVFERSSAFSTHLHYMHQVIRADPVQVLHYMVQLYPQGVKHKTTKGRNVPADVETMAYAKFSERDVPWHFLGTPVDHLMTAAEAIEAAGLDWGVEKRPLLVSLADGSTPLVEDRFGVVRDTDKKVLGIVGSDYRTFGNKSAFEFFDRIVDSGDAKYDTAGALHGGKRIWLTAKLPQSMQVAGGDEHHLYILLSTSHDGSLAIRGDVTPVRVVCTNTQQLAFARARMTWSITHREGVEGKVQEAREALQLTFKGADSFKELADKMASVQVTDEQFRAIMEKAFPAQKNQTEKNVTAILLNRNESQTIPDEMRPTGWGAYNALTEWFDHVRTYRSAEAKMRSLTNGGVQVLRSRVAAGILEMAGK